MAMSTSGQNLVQTWLLTGGAATRPTTWFVALHAGASGPNGAANELPTANGYARQAQTQTVAGNVGTGVADLIFGPCTNVDWGLVTDFSLWTAVTGGTCLWVGTLGASVSYAVNDTATLDNAVNTYTLT